MATAAPSSCTEFLSPDRADHAELHRQYALLQRQTQLSAVADAVPQPLAVLNAERQIVWLNDLARQMLGVSTAAQLQGQRPGEALGCEVAHHAAGGCGTASECCDCGAVLAVLEARRAGRGQRSCVVSRGAGQVPLELDVTASLLEVEGEPFILVALMDIHHQERRRTLERLFFHDVLNTAGGLLGLSEANLGCLPDAPDQSLELSRLLVGGCRQLLEEITAQRDLAAAEAGELVVRTETLPAAAAVSNVCHHYRFHPAAEGRSLIVRPGPAACVHTDAILLGRVLGNLIKNALEATAEGGEVTVTHTASDGQVHFQVVNPGEVPPEVRPHFFLRKSSSKGVGRGLGTYSVRLLAEGYLGGRVTWTSDPQDGTRVTISLPTVAN